MRAFSCHHLSSLFTWRLCMPQWCVIIHRNVKGITDLSMYVPSTPIYLSFMKSQAWYFPLVSNPPLAFQNLLLRKLRKKHTKNLLNTNMPALQYKQKVKIIWNYRKYEFQNCNFGLFFLLYGIGLNVSQCFNIKITMNTCNLSCNTLEMLDYR